MDIDRDRFARSTRRQQDTGVFYGAAPVHVPANTAQQVPIQQLPPASEPPTTQAPSPQQVYPEHQEQLEERKLSSREQPFTTHSDDNVIELSDSDAAHHRSKLKPIAIWGGATVMAFALSVGAGAYASYRDSGSKKTDGQTLGAQTEAKTDGNGGILLNNAEVGSSSPYQQFTKQLNGANVAVNKQPLPDDYKTDPTALEKFANNLGKTEKIQTDKWGTAYVFTEPNKSAQIVVAANSSTLVIMQTPKVQAMGDWQNFINSNL